MHTATIVDNAVYVSASTKYPNGTCYKLDANSGSVIWNVTIPDWSTAPGGNLFASPTVASDLGMVFVRADRCFNYALNATTGQTIWIHKNYVDPGQPLRGGPEQHDAILYVDSLLYFNNYYVTDCLNATDGSVVWESYLARETVAPGISYAYQRLYFVNQNRVLYVLDAQTGANFIL